MIKNVYGELRVKLVEYWKQGDIKIFFARGREGEGEEI